MPNRQRTLTTAKRRSLVSLQKTAQSTSALALVGQTVVVNGATAQLTSNGATWTLNTSKPTNATVTIADSTGQTAYTGTFALNAGAQTFTWDGHGNDGRLWPAGSYTLTATGIDASGQSSAVRRSIPSTSRSRRRSCPSMDRTTRSTRSRRSSRLKAAVSRRARGALPAARPAPP
jgi:flagellar hook assembly protein FlgD